MYKKIGIIPQCFKIYEEGDISILNLDDLKDFLLKKTGIEVFLCGNIFKGISEKDINTLSKEFAKLRIKDPMKKLSHKTFHDTEVQYEKERIKEEKWKPFGILYEAILYQNLLNNLVLKDRLSEKDCAILITNQIIATRDKDDLRFHIRTSLYGFPNIISLPGLVLGPAKPRDFYIKRQVGIPLEILKKEYKDRFIDHEDSKINEVLKGYLIQALFFHLTGDPFCEDPDCRLFNSHWQEDMIHAQLNGKYEFCPKHEEILREIKERNMDNNFN